MGWFSPTVGEEGWSTVQASSGWNSLNPFTDFDLSSPFSQSFPTSTADVTALGWSSNVLAGWSFQDDVGTTLADFTGNGNTMTTASSKCLTGQPAVGFSNSATFRAQRCAELFNAPANADRFELGSSATFDFDWTTPWSALVVFRVPDGTQTGSRGLIGKYGAQGWLIYLAGSNLFAFGQTPGGSAQAQPTGVYTDGAWHWVYARFDPVTDTIRCDTDLSTGASASSAALTTTANAARMSIGGSVGANGAACQIRLAVLWNDVSTSVASIQSWWKHGGVPSWLNYTRASTFTTTVEDDSTVGDTVATWATGSVAYEYNTLISTNSRKLGLSSYAGGTNLIPGTDLNDATNWPAAGGGGTKTAYSENSPRGFRESIKHTGTSTQSVLCSAGNGAAVTAATVYTASVWCRWDGTGTAPELEVYRADGTTLISEVSAMTSGRARRLTVTFTAPATEAIRIALKGRDGNAWFWGPMVNVGAYARPWIFTKGGTATSAAIQANVRVSGLRSDQGTVKVWSTFAGQDSGASRFYFSVLNSSASRNYSREIQLNPSEVAVLALYTSAGAFSSQVVVGGVQADVASAESVVTAWWDRSEANGWSLRGRRNASDANDATDMPAGDSATEVIAIGSSFGQANQIDGAVSKVRVWKKVFLGA